jgi:hypothetical protein
VLAGCDPDDTSDAGTDAAVADVPATDTPATDTPLPDAPIIVDAADAPPGCDCDADQTCLRGVCIATCDGVDGFDAALAADVVPVAHACRSAAAFDVVGTNVYELTATPGSSGTVLALVRWSFLDGAVTASTLAQRTYVPTGTEAVYPGYVTVSDDESHALFGYTTGLPGFVGGVVNVDASAMTFDEISAPGNFDGAFVDGTQYVINGLGFGALTGQALYLADAAVDSPAGERVVDSMGDASGSVALWSEEGMVVFGGANYGGPWPDDSTGGYVFFLPAASVVEAGTPVDAFVTAERLRLPGAFEMLSGGRLLEVYYGDTGVDGLRFHGLSVNDEGEVSSAEPTDITTGGTFFNAGAIGDDVLLVHGSGSLRVTMP